MEPNNIEWKNILAKYHFERNNIPLAKKQINDIINLTNYKNVNALYLMAEMCYKEHDLWNAMRYIQVI